MKLCKNTTRDRCSIVITAFVLIAAMVMMFLSAPRKGSPVTSRDEEEALGAAQIETGQTVPESDPTAGSSTLSESEPQHLIEVPTSEIQVDDLHEIKIPITGLEEEIQAKLEEMFVDPTDSPMVVEPPKLDTAHQPID
jgi:hypothetical protein